MDVERLDPRQQRTRELVLAAARTVLRREGVQGATLEGIAAESGVARSTLYRNWSSREQLLDDAINDLVAPPPPSSTDEPLRQLGAVLEHLAASLDDSEWGGTLPSIVAAIDASHELAVRYQSFVDGRRADVRRIIRAAVDSNALPTSVDADDLIDELAGPLFYRRLIRRVPTTAEWTRAHTERILSAHAATG